MAKDRKDTRQAIENISTRYSFRDFEFISSMKANRIRRGKSKFGSIAESSKVEILLDATEKEGQDISIQTIEKPLFSSEIAYSKESTLPQLCCISHLPAKYIHPHEHLPFACQPLSSVVAHLPRHIVDEIKGLSEGY
ncbi:hypothetical protein ADUPG1_007323 [Aduncisulcus paluster]|uniref:Uncharacterized protein n=1 Tax=Aduncisulcus paluster TaxID=2918883 RepID=A0ABQ5KLM4_9EUKA|nr:hypothetical protein ADUPG1_007323 [Aduncisulcus paluster]|eukprot:gnl/Carplike_NY0171/6634_a9105_191.p1 GENE.gnl/Carplike_NY0171/6634_a9105_191~~gnl/Carplike_NY0171/6634_a9105_191.p1  ORF type:complete len:137 (+),score=22.31 gnl/Carplike_NY0171/6634_a9105_191:75-485(+)